MLSILGDFLVVEFSYLDRDNNATLDRVLRM